VLIAIFSVQMPFSCSKNDIFLVCSTNFLVCRNFFCACSSNFCCLMMQILQPYKSSFGGSLSAQYKLFPSYGTGFALFCRLMVNFWSAVQSLLHFSRGVGCKNLSMDSLLLSKTSETWVLNLSIFKSAWN
jgi:hypothetical protein